MKSRLTFCLTCGRDLVDGKCPDCDAPAPVSPPRPMKSPMNFRERWYRDQGLPYEPPPVVPAVLETIVQL